MRDAIHGSVKFIFQPAEEGPPAGEEGGAPLMIKQGALDNPRAKAIFGLHISTWYPAGKIGYSSGPAMASADSLNITIRGKRVHGATPHQGIDTVVVASQCVLALQTIKSRRIDNSEPLVLTIGSIHGGNRHNIITDEVKMQGTLRTLSEEIREKVRAMVRQTLDGCTQMLGASYQLEWVEPNYPVTFNDPALTAASLGALERVMGKENVVAGKPTMGSEDFSYYQKVIPGFFWFLGAANPAKNITAAHHTADFDVDEDVLGPGVKAAVNQLLDYLDRER
jgi:amidohydrolase